MATIRLDVKLNTGSVDKDLKILKAQIKAAVSTLSDVKIDKNLTEQIKTLTQYYKQYEKVSVKVVEAAQKQRIAEEKLNQEKAKTAQINAKVAESESKARRAAELAEEAATKKAETERKIAENREKASTLDITNVQKLIKKYAELSLRIKNVASQYPSGTFDAVLKNVQGGLQKAQQLEKALAQTIINENNPATKEQIEQYKELTKEFQAYDTEVSTAKDSTDKLRTAVIKNGDSIVDMAKKFVIWQAAATLVMQPLNLIRTALTSINETLVETEDMVVGIRRVLDTDVLPDEISSKVYSIAQRYGQTRDNVADILGNFARSGLS